MFLIFLQIFSTCSFSAIPVFHLLDLDPRHWLKGSLGRLSPKVMAIWMGRLTDNSLESVKQKLELLRMSSLEEKFHEQLQLRSPQEPARKISQMSLSLQVGVFALLFARIGSVSCTVEVVTSDLYKILTALLPLSSYCYRCFEKFKTCRHLHKGIVTRNLKTIYWVDQSF